MTQDTIMQKNFKGILTIDCWEEEFLNDFYQTLDNYIDFSCVESIICANYDLALDSKTDLSQYNLLSMWSWTNNDQKILHKVVEHAHTKSTSEWLKSKFKTHSVLLLDTESIIKHCNTFVPHINDWLVIGGAWGICTHSRPVCLQKLSKLKQNFYIAPWSIYNENGRSITERHIREDKSVTWIKTNDYFRAG